MTPEQRRALAIAMTGAKQILTETADDLMTDQMTSEKWTELGMTLDYLRDLVKRASMPDEPPHFTGGGV